MMPWWVDPLVGSSLIFAILAAVALWWWDTR